MEQSAGQKIDLGQCMKLVCLLVRSRGQCQINIGKAGTYGTKNGIVGVKVWIYKGEVLPTRGNKEGSDK